ncbi:recombinase family protein [Tsuneonella sp. CC-YZS046]|uniref:recombinase family protein n=1 Tax=Tsuneonella sp. CC-YZS046 TaxID=3042152 RepID=UPI002D78185F|nr:recombinase family protein [Tsuneonella sp. CC-YZS046]WRO65543.1 recombinase family protein [Tsuneonella sp. CC-YZS046]
MIGSSIIPDKLHLNHRLANEISTPRKFGNEMIIRGHFLPMASIHPQVDRGRAGAGVNSLDAQREACEAYILSQRHEGWSLVPSHYDDGGYSGGNTERPRDRRGGPTAYNVCYRAFAHDPASRGIKCRTRTAPLVGSLQVQRDHIVIKLRPDALGIETDAPWNWCIPLPPRKPFREAKLRIDADTNELSPDADLLKLLADAMAAQQLVFASPELSLNQLGKREGRRCRTQLARLLRIAWLSPRIVEAIADGSQPRMLTRKSLLTGSIPTSWSEQERQFGFAA